VNRFELAAQNHLFSILCVAAGGSSSTPGCRPGPPPVFVLLSLGGLLFVLGWPTGGWVVGIGGGLIAVCYLPIHFALRVTAIGLAAFALTLLRVEYQEPIWPSSARCSCSG